MHMLKVRPLFKCYVGLGLKLGLILKDAEQVLVSGGERDWRRLCL